ncbi:MAG: hypothetical protein JWR07_1776 [Nevskia sp.]|nr:hypothetical protein [Nevskia sp.]
MSTSRMFILAAVAAASITGQAIAAVSPDEAAKLKTTLTPLGAERAGNADGSIPAWTGGYTTVVPGWTPDKPRPDPFADEKPLYSVTGENADKYGDKLSEGVKAVLKKYPDWRIDVYPTHRTAAAPQYVYDNTYANATRAELVNDGISTKGAYGGIPFPIVKTGAEAIWNHLLSWHAESKHLFGDTLVMTSDGKLVLASTSDSYMQYPYYDHHNSLEKFGDGDFWWLDQTNVAPPYKAGERLLVRDPVDIAKGRKAWQYLVGQRRVRLAPTVAFDTPNFITSGVANFDETFMFNGSPERYTWKLVGKKEMIVPYNQNRLGVEAQSGHEDQIAKPHFLNPDLTRWELHRVWVVEGELRPGARHTEPKRRFYLDEDTWFAMLAESYDAQGHLWKYYQAIPFLYPDLPGVVSESGVVFNLLDGNYVVDFLQVKPTRFIPNMPASAFTPEAIAASSVK